MDPSLPPELEHRIFETAGLAYPGIIPTLLRVARRVHIWIEPLLYRVIWVDPHAHATKTAAVRAAIHSKPADFFKAAVRHLFLDGSSEFSEEEAEILLRLCQNLVTFAATGVFSRPRQLPILAGMHVRRLSGCLNKLFGSRDAVDFGHPLFLSITHLDVFVDLADAAMYTRLAAIPALTHLCLNGVIAWDIFHGLLADCSTLKLLVNVWNHQSASPAEKFADATPFVDARFVVATFMDYWADWEAGRRGAGLLGSGGGICCEEAQGRDPSVPLLDGSHPALE
ncbi:hypothetical protein B0H13DRAFT_2665615 [Mycena leptocephala]|nr:hypothetical protein B0H13DRAFT_2665615 [Mycena leptocephala]